MSVLTFSLAGKSESPTRFVARARQFEIVVDEPAALGGADSAANPVEYILAGFAGCLNVVGHLVARDLGFELHRLEVSLQGDIDPARFLGQATEQRAGYQGLQVILTPHADASPEILALWLQQVTDRCPVHDNLRQQTPVSLVLSETV
ncbi:MAG: OsmC family protein [Bacteroidia bacterium]|nr:OsmC family protein [Bacteroidia bacterium]